MAIKRASPGASDEKDPYGFHQPSPDDEQKIKDVDAYVSRAELVVERAMHKSMTAAYAHRREDLKAIPHFWPVTLINSPETAIHIQHQADQLALSYLVDLWVERDPTESRCFALEFHFKENPYFTDTVLKKQFKYVPPPAAADEKPDADGITDSMLDFDWSRDVKNIATEIHWKDAEKALTKLYPVQPSEEEGDDMPMDPGSFFNFFEQETDPYDIGVSIAEEIFANATTRYMGREDVDSDDSEEEDSEDDDEAAEIDLEKPRVKKQKVKDV
ncbi:hypothetical protein FISHEDRAFT_67583 [Fistulina hepatica ATCC 64428]|nr:hypothetical protein FISHEDRAFT_67583 [Fistulina hepatica ATCC 64428]